MATVRDLLQTQGLEAGAMRGRARCGHMAWWAEGVTRYWTPTDTAGTVVRNVHYVRCSYVRRWGRDIRASGRSIGRVERGA